MIAALFYRPLAATMSNPPGSGLPGIFLLMLIVHANPAAAMTASEAETLIRSAPCSNGQNIEAVLGQKINTASQRDLGWQVFEDEGSFVVERAVLISKSMQLRYRWQIDNQGKLQPASDRAEDLCTPVE